jgi:hypothetical protein
MEAGEMTEADMCPASGGPDRDRLGGPDHAVEHLDGKGDLALLA